MTEAPTVEADLGWALGAVMRSYLRAVGDVVADVPGGPRGYQVLAATSRGGPGSQQALAHQLGIDRTVMTYLLDDLEGAGLVERRPDPADRRARRVELTDVGARRVCELEGKLQGAEAALLGPLRPEEGAVLRSLLQRLATSVSSASPCDVAQDLASADGIAATTRR